MPEDRGIVVFVAPPWGTALDEVQGLDLRLTTPPISEIIEQILHQFPKHNILLATQVYEKVGVPSLTEVQTKLNWTELRASTTSTRKAGTTVPFWE